MTKYALNETVKVTPVDTIAAIQAYMADKRKVSGSELKNNVPELSGKPANEIEQAVLDAGYQVIEE